MSSQSPFPRRVLFDILGISTLFATLVAVGCSSSNGRASGYQGGGGSGALPSLGATVASSGSFSSGEQGAIYTITVSNNGTAATSGTVTVVDPPTGFTVTAMSGSNWTCTLTTTTCTNSTSVIPGQSFPPITVTGNVTSAVGTPVSIPLNLSGGGTSPLNVTPTPTVTVAAAALAIRKTHTGNFMQGQQGATYAVIVSNGTNTGATNGTVTVTEIPPGGELTVTGMAGTNWTCTVATLTCTRSDSLVGGASYDQIMVTVNVSATATSPLINQVMVAGGGSANASANDATSINPSGGSRFTTVDAPGAGTTADMGTIPQEINQSGDIVGYLYDSKGIVHGFVRDSAGTFTVFEAPGATTTKCCLGTFAQSINSSGTVVGYFVDDTLSVHGYVRTQNGTFTIFDVGGVSGTAPSSINDGGVITGTVSDINQHLRGFVRATDGSFTTFDAPGVIGTGQFVGTIPERINSGGLVVGYFMDTNNASRGFVRAVDGTITILDASGTTPPCNCGTRPMDINASGAIVGVTYAAGVAHCFVRAPDGTYTLFDPPNAVISGTGSGAVTAVAVNDNNSIVGNYRDSNAVLHGFLRNPDGSFTILDDPNSMVTGSFGTGTTDINSNGAIVGYYGDPLGASHGYEWQ